ncbi:MAG: hypothetical protein QOH13_2169 [Thermoleophilaceae bacterium]|nr:hypothetical protein [Thermoleophilaceae bacterium]
MGEFRPVPRLGLWALGAGLLAVAVIVHPGRPWAAVLGLGGVACMFGAWLLNARSGSLGRGGDPSGAGGGSWGDGSGSHSAGMTGGDGGGGGGGDFGAGGSFGGGDFGGGGGGDGGGGGG